MADFSVFLREKAGGNLTTIVFPEYEDKRVVEAVKIIEQENIAKPVIVSPDTIEKDKLERFAGMFYEKRKHKGMTLEKALEQMKDPLYYASMLVNVGEADSIVAGANHTTGDMIRSTIFCIGVDKSIGLISSCFVMAVPDCSFGHNGVFVFADCGVIPYPTAEERAAIAIAAADFGRELLGTDPKVALLSFSTKGSAKGESIDSVRASVELVKEKRPDIAVDGELQLDAALVPEVASLKLSDSPVAGKANVLIFPDLDAGNIGYKLTQRLAKAKAWGPLLLGASCPCTDLSRGCSVEDIVDITAINAIRVQGRKNK